MSIIRLHRDYKSYTKNLIFYFGASIIPMILNLVSNPWIAKNMAPKDYAISGYYLSYSSLISPVIIFYMIHFYIKEYFRRNDDERTRLYSVIAKATIWFSGLVAIFCFLALFIYLNYFDESLSFPVMPYLAMMVFALPLSGLSNLQLAQYRMEKKAVAYFRLSITNGLLNILIMLILIVWMKWGAFGKLLSPLICNITIFTYLLFKFRNVLRLKTTLTEFKTIFIFCLPLATSAMLGYFTNGFSTTYLESIGNVNEYGIYVVGASIGTYLMVFSTAISNTFQPDLYETTIKKHWNKFIKFCLLQTGLITLVTIIFIILAPLIISILTANRYNASTPYAQIIAVSAITSNIYFLINNYTIATNRPKLYLYTTIIGSILIIILMPSVVATWSFYGGAWMSVVSFIIFSIINLFCILSSRINIRPIRTR